MPRKGRPSKSIIRQNIVELLAVIGKGYGYEIHKKYLHFFPPCTREVIYYHLKKGLKTEEFAIESVKQEEGEYSWGNKVEKTYYTLGKEAKPKGDHRLKSL